MTIHKIYVDDIAEYILNDDKIYDEDIIGLRPDDYIVIYQYLNTSENKIVYRYIKSTYNKLYSIINGEYRFYDADTRIKYMSRYSITCGCQRVFKDNKLTLCYNNKPMTEEQKIFIQKRAKALKSTVKIKLKGCNCGKKQRP